MTAARRALAALLLCLGTLPLYRLLAGGGTGPAGSATLRMTADYVAFTWSALLLLLPLALLCGWLIPTDATDRALSRIGTAVGRVPALALDAAAAVLAFAFAWFINARVFYGEPNLIDAMAQLVQARYLAAGQLAGPASPTLGGFWHMQQTLATPAGWVAQYPPGHAFLLALGMRLGAPQLVGPLLLALTVFCTGRLARTLFPTQRALPLLATLLLALSPFAAAHAAAYMSHTAAALFAVLALLGSARFERSPHWSLAALAGAAIGALFTIRPLTAAVVAVVCIAFVLRRARLPHVAAFVLAASPLLVLLGWWNLHFFGSPFRFGYAAALGPAGSLGFGTDPWGNHYGLRAALGYTAAELHALNLFLLETPLPIVTLIALYLLLARSLERGTRVVLAWAALPLLAHLFYWHHGLFMGPRMLNEYAPAWCLLAAIAAVAAVRAAPASLARLRTFSPRSAVLGGLALAWIGALVYFAPARLATYRSPVLPLAYAASTLPEPSLVFVHGSWATRLAMRLAARGMRLDSVETALRQNSTCTVQRWLDGERLQIVLDRNAAKSASPPQRELPSGSRVRFSEGEPWPRSCARQLASDSAAVVEVSAYLWRAGLPGIHDGRSLLVRDLGPELDIELIRALRRRAYVLTLDPAAGRIQLEPYGPVMRRLWPDTTTTTGTPVAGRADAP